MQLEFEDFAMLTSLPGALQEPNIYGDVRTDYENFLQQQDDDIDTVLMDLHVFILLDSIIKLYYLSMTGSVFLFALSHFKQLEHG